MNSPRFVRKSAVAGLRLFVPFLSILTAAGACDPSSDGFLEYSEAEVEAEEPLAESPHPDEFSTQNATAWEQSSDNVRILSYNVALVEGRAHHKLLPSVSAKPNNERFAGLDDVDRAAMIADRILATDQDVVVLNEVFNEDARAVFVQMLAGSGAYPHYVSKLRSHAVLEGLSLQKLAEMETQDLSGIWGELLNTLLGLVPLPVLDDYIAEHGDSGLMLFSKYPFLEYAGSKFETDALCKDDVAGLPACATEGSNNGGPIDDRVVFRRFDKCVASDCLASKGVGMVRIGAPQRDLFVAFTHLQADYADDDLFLEEFRASQFDTIRDVILDAVPSPKDSAVFLAGDLNVGGYDRTSSYAAPREEWHNTFHPDQVAGGKSVADGFFACGNGVDTGSQIETCKFNENGSRYMTDTWGFETSPTDLGLTSSAGTVGPQGSYRLDYVLRSAGASVPIEGLCTQHATIAWDLQAPDGSGALSWLSDHLPVRVDIGPSAEHCSANTDPDVPLPSNNTHILTFGPTNCSDSSGTPPCDQDELISAPAASLGPAGAFQWYRIDQPGSYSIRTEGHDSQKRVQHHVYHHTDLSRQISPFDEEEGEWGTLYSLHDPPYYIRTFAVDSAGRPDRTLSDVDYTISVHQHLCRSPEDACALPPGTGAKNPVPYDWPWATDPLSNVRDLYWKFKASGTAGGRLLPGEGPGIAFPNIDMHVEAASEEALDCLTQVEPQIEVYADPVFGLGLQEQLAVEPWDMSLLPQEYEFGIDTWPDQLYDAPDLPGVTNDEFQTYFFKVTRNSEFGSVFSSCTQPMTSWIAYNTDLTYVRLDRWEMWAELDDSDDKDDLLIHLGFDAAGYTTPPPPWMSGHHSLHDVSSGAAVKGLAGDPWLQGYFTNETWLTLWEQDDNVRLHKWNPYNSSEAIPTLPSNIESVTGSRFQASDGPNGDDADYYQFIDYTRCHQRDHDDCK